MNSFSKFPILILFLFLFSQITQAGLLYTYNELALKDLDHMSSIANEKLAEAKKSRSGKVVPLKEGLQAIYSRPNEDGLLEKVIAPIKVELDRHQAYEKTMEALIKEALDALGHPQNFKPKVQVTYMIFLENVISQMRPRIQTDSFESRMITQISQTSITLSKEAINERKLRLMRESTSPSEIALEVLKNVKPSPATPPVKSASESEPDKGESEPDKGL